MLWRNRRESGNILDQRRVGGKTLGGGALIIGAIIYGLMGGNPLDYIAQNTGSVRQQQAGMTSPGQNPHDDDPKRFVGVVLADTEDVWNSIFSQSNVTYQEPQLVLFSQAVRSACGRASSAVGPFYCPADQRVYLDLTFFNQLSQRLGAQGDFAQAYVIAHEVGHHVQHLLGIEESFRREQRGLGERERNRMSVQLELQADCLAGVWARQTDRAKNVIEAGDIEEAMGAAAAVGDDRLQQAARGEVMPDSFTHGSSAQRVHAFQLGFSEGNPQDCLEARSF